MFVEDNGSCLPKIHSPFTLGSTIPILFRVAPCFAKNTSGFLCCYGSLVTQFWTMRQKLRVSWKDFFFFFIRSLFLPLSARNVDAIPGDTVAVCHLDVIILKTKTYVLRMMEWENRRSLVPWRYHWATMNGPILPTSLLPSLVLWVT